MRNKNGTIISAPPGFRDVVDRVDSLFGELVHGQTLSDGDPVR